MSNPEHVARMLAHQAELGRVKDLTSVPFFIASPYIVDELAPDWFLVVAPDGKVVANYEDEPQPLEAAEHLASLLNEAWRTGFQAVFNPNIPASWKRDALKTDGADSHTHPVNPGIACGCPYGKDE